jgi:ATP-dependent Zn protease
MLCFIWKIAMLSVLSHNFVISFNVGRNFFTNFYTKKQIFRIQSDKKNYYLSQKYIENLQKQNMNNANNTKKETFRFKSNKKFYYLSERYIEYLQNRYTNNDDKKISNTNYLNNIEDNSLSNYYEKLLKKLNSNNCDVRDNAILNNDNLNIIDKFYESNNNQTKLQIPRVKIVLKNSNNFLSALGVQIIPDGNTLPLPDSNLFENNNNDDDDDDELNSRRRIVTNSNKKSKNFEVIQNSNISFKDIGGYDNVKNELNQCVDMLKNYKKYSKYNVRIPKGLILEGPPGTGKTLLAKSLAGEAGCAFIAVAGSDFQEKYVGVGPTRIKELFKLARNNKPCIIFIDEIDALGRKRSSDNEGSSNERDNTLNALLVELDGFKNLNGVFVVSSTNRVDLLDNALTRPGRMDKQIFIGLPDKITREAIINIHIKGKPYDETIKLTNLIEITEGLTGAQIENLLNEAMLNALRNNKTEFNFNDFNLIMNKMLAGWQPNEHEFTTDIIDRIAIHEMGHAIVGILSKHHSKMSKVVINLSSPKSPGYTVFEKSTSNIYIKEALFEHLMILLSGRIAEEIFYNISVTTGALNDFEEALKLAERMIIYYGMGSNIIYPHNSEKYKELIDNEISYLINKAYNYSRLIVIACKDLIYETSEILKKDKLLNADELNNIISKKYNHLLELKIKTE